MSFPSRKLDRVEQNDGEAEDSSEESLDAALEGSSILFAIGGAAVSIAAPPVALGLGVTSGAVQLAALVRGRWRRRAAAVTAGATQRLGTGVGEAAKRITTNEDLAALSYRSVEASIQANSDDQARAIGRVLGEALRSADPISIDEAAILVESMRSLDLIHFRALSDLADNQVLNWMQVVLGALNVTDEAVAFGVASALQRAGAIQLDPPGFGGYSVTPLGRRLLKFIKD